MDSVDRKLFSFQTLASFSVLCFWLLILFLIIRKQFWDDSRQKRWKSKNWEISRRAQVRPGHEWGAEKDNLFCLSWKKANYIFRYYTVPCHNFSPKKEKSNLRQRAAAVKLINLWCFLWSFSSSTAWIFSRKYKLFEGPFLICFELFICKAVKIWVIKRSEKWSRMWNWWLPWCCLVLS